MDMAFCLFITIFVSIYHMMEDEEIFYFEGGEGTMLGAIERNISDDEFVLVEVISLMVEENVEHTDSESESYDDFFLRQPLRLRRMALQVQAVTPPSDVNSPRPCKKVTSLDKTLDFNYYGPAIPHPTAAEGLHLLKN